MNRIEYIRGRSKQALGAWAAEGSGASKLTRFQINTKSVKANKMNISIESLSLIEDMDSEEIILRNSCYFTW